MKAWKFSSCLVPEDGKCLGLQPLQTETGRGGSGQTMGCRLGLHTKRGARGAKEEERTAFGEVALEILAHFCAGKMYLRLSVAARPSH